MVLRGPRRLALELLLIAIPYFLVAASFTSWWGGTTAPARYFVPITPLLAVPAAFWFANIEERRDAHWPAWARCSSAS